MDLSDPDGKLTGTTTLSQSGPVEVLVGWFYGISSFINAKSIFMQIVSSISNNSV